MVETHFPPKAAILLLHHKHMKLVKPFTVCTTCYCAVRLKRILISGFVP